MRYHLRLGASLFWVLPERLHDRRHAHNTRHGIDTSLRAAATSPSRIRSMPVLLASLKRPHDKERKS